VNAGTVDRINNKVSVRFDGSNDGLTTSSFTQNDGNYSSYAVNYQRNTSLGIILNGDPVSGTRNPQYIRNTPTTGVPETIPFYLSTPVVEGGVTTSPNTLILLSAHQYSTSVQIYSNGTGNGATSITGNSNVTSSQLDIGYLRASSASYFNGEILEVILYGSNQHSNKTNVENNINTYYSIY
jgi:hypothetical protein